MSSRQPRIVWLGHPTRSRFYVRFWDRSGHVKHVAATPRLASRPARVPLEAMEALVRVSREASRPARVRQTSAGRALTHDELTRLSHVADAQAADVPRRLTWAYFRLMLMLGTRPGELRRLKWSSVTPWGVTLDVTKREEGAKKVVAMCDELRTLLEEVRALPRAREDVVFGYWKTDGTARAELQRLWEELRKRADLTGVRLHDARSTVGTMMTREQGLRAAQMALGHANYSTTERWYVHEAKENRVDLSVMAKAIS